jgi:hypothetical protein
MAKSSVALWKISNYREGRITCHISEPYGGKGTKVVGNHISGMLLGLSKEDSTNQQKGCF